MNIRQNRRIASFPGVVVRNRNAHNFQLTDDPILAQNEFNNLNGRVILKMTRVGQAETANFVIPLPEYEGILELAAVLRHNNDNNYANYQDAPPYQVRNVEASLRQQIQERDGFAVAFVADYSAAFPSAKEEEFRKQAEEMIATLPTFKLDNNQVKMGYYEISDSSTIANTLRDLREAVRTLLEMPTSPKVAMLACTANTVHWLIPCDSVYNL
ncbi:hypothetical protein HYR99_20330 [Candidatus Poribacteria bacterium]|nr:hypothetical protein [Candidatus Poribacteria bacterium]